MTPPPETMTPGAACEAGFPERTEQPALGEIHDNSRTGRASPGEIPEDTQRARQLAFQEAADWVQHYRETEDFPDVRTIRDHFRELAGRHPGEPENG